MQQGTQANRTGNQLESHVEHALHEHGYTLFPDHKKQLFANRDAVGGKQYGRHVLVGPSIYESPRIVDFLVINKDKFPEWDVASRSEYMAFKFNQTNTSSREDNPLL